MPRSSCVHLKKFYLSRLQSTRLAPLGANEHSYSKVQLDAWIPDQVWDDSVFSENSVFFEK